jgi:hypothetical protein
MFSAELDQHMLFTLLSLSMAATGNSDTAQKSQINCFIRPVIHLYPSHSFFCPLPAPNTMKFGKTLLKNQIPEWSRNYINYKALKKRVNRAAEEYRVGKQQACDDSVAGT